MFFRIAVCPASMCLVLFVVAFACSSGSAIAQTEELGVQSLLSEEGERRKAAHNFLLGEFANHHTVTKSADGKVIQEVVLSTKREIFEKELLLALPEGSQRVASMFRYLILEGENLDKLGGLTMLPYAEKGHLHHSKQTSEFYRVQVASLPVPTLDMPPIQLRATIESDERVVIDRVLFHSQGRLMAEFDDIPFRNLGSEFPRTPVILEVDAKHELSIGGHIKIDRDKWFRYYGAPGTSHSSLEKWAAERNFRPGRQIFKFQPALVVGYSQNQPKLKERSDRPGSADLRFFEKYHPGVSKSIPEFEGLPYAMAFDNWPDFMSRVPNGRGTPKLKFFDAAAELAAAYVEAEHAKRGRSATWWEVKNESSIKSEWDYHWEQGLDSWKLLAEFHNQVSRAIKKTSPQTRVGGPASAWMQVQTKDFDLYRRQQRFMDLTKGHLDFYSHHFYEDIGSLGAYERSGSNYRNYLLGRLEAILDMFCAHMHGTENVRPILLTELGSLQAGRGPSDYWLRIRSYNAYLTKLMRRPHQVDLAVPFAFLNVPWNPTSGNAAFVPVENAHPNGPIEGFQSTPVAYFFELWRNFQGRRLPVNFSHPWLDAVAVHDSSQVQIAMTSMGGRRLSIDLRSLLDQVSESSIEQKRLYYRDGEVHFEDAIRVEDPSQIPIDVEETTIITIRTNEPLRPKGTIRRDVYFSGRTAVGFGDLKEANFEVNGISSDKPIDRLTLVVGLQRDGGISEPLEGSFNGQPFEARIDWARTMNHVFAPARIELGPGSLTESNIVLIRSMPGLTITSVHLEIDTLEK